MPLSQQLTKPVPESAQTPFGLEEIVISRTDLRGIIQAGNSAFRRLSGLDWPELIGSPHNALRSSDTPKAVISHVWATLEQGLPVAAYIRNKSEGGEWNWVLATIIPIKEGYVVFCLKPSSPLFPQVKAIYEEVLTLESSTSIKVGKSWEVLIERLHAFGFVDYSDFMASALSQELSAHDAAPGGAKAAAQLWAPDATRDGLIATRSEQAALLKEFEALQSIPTNMRIIASRLEPSGGPISAISDNYKFASTEISRRLDEFAGSKDNLCSAMANAVCEAIFQLGCARLQASAAQWFDLGGNSDLPFPREAEVATLAGLEAEQIAKTQSKLRLAAKVLGEFNQACIEIRRMMLGLDTIRVMGRVESGRLGSAGAGLAATIDQLDKRHTDIAARLQRLIDLSASIMAVMTMKRPKAF